MSYAHYLASRGYTRATVQRTEKVPGHLVLNHNARPAERVPSEQRTVVEIRGKRKAGVS